MSLPKFDLPECLSNPDGWGPTGSAKDSSVLKEFEGLPYQHCKLIFYFLNLI